jgi:hypothetical protein
MTTSCLSCTHIGLKSSPAMAQHGFGHCEFDAVGQFKSIASTCDRHAQADSAIVAKREAWALNRGRK